MELLQSKEEYLREQAALAYITLIKRANMIEIVEESLTNVLKTFQQLDDNHKDYQLYLSIFGLLIQSKEDLILEFLEKHIWKTPMQLPNVDIIKNNALVLGPRLLEADFPKNGIKLLFD